MTVIKQEDFIQSICDAFQFISYYHPKDYIDALYKAWQKEENPAAKDAMTQILVNSRMCAENNRPICQDTGIATVFLKVGMDVQWDADMSVEEMVNEGVRRAYTWEGNTLRASVLADPAGKRQNTKDNTPAVIHMSIVPGGKVEVTCAAKGGGSENKSKLAMLNPSDNIVDWVLKTIPTMGAGWCPPGILGIGIGGTPEKAVLMAKESLMSHIDIQELQEKAASGAELSTTEALRLELFEKVNALGIGAQGLGGLTTVLDVKILDYPTHAASKPIAMIPNCAATRHVEFELDGSGPVELTPPRVEDWPDLTYSPDNGKRVDVDKLTKEEVASWKTGDVLLLNGKILTGRDAAHKRLVNMLDKGEELPVDFTNRLIYYVGPSIRSAMKSLVPQVRPQPPAWTNLPAKCSNKPALGMIGKSERGAATCEAIADNKAVYLMAVGGAAYLVAKAIKSSKVLAFPELGMEAVYEFEVKDMPVTVAVDSKGESIHATAPRKWQAKIGIIPVES